MARPDPTKVRRVACIGTGLMGGGWVAHFLARGMDVVAQDPDPKAKEKLARTLDAAWPPLTELGLEPGASRDRVRVVSSVAEAVKDAEFVQESAPERIDLKIKLLAEIDRHAPPDIVIASSTSGFVMSSMYGECARPERLVVGHPFNPPYLMPLVEVCGGAKTSKEVVDWACRFYEHNGQYALKMVKEVEGFLANRLQQALWNECLMMVRDGLATPEQLNAALRYGPGLRWAMMGHFMLQHMAGGEGGIRHSIDHFAPAEGDGYSYLKSPGYTPALKAEVIAACDEITEGKSYQELAKGRDKNLVAFLKALRANKGWPAG
jgi:carnitine 3-dehydrogenase